MSISCRMLLNILCTISSFQIRTVENLRSFKANNACSSRPDGRCVRCNGVPECFDLSDEAGCPYTALKFIPVQEASKSCREKRCLKNFPDPPPLPPFSLCEDLLQPTTTSQTPVSTTVTTPATTKPATQTTSTEAFYSTWPFRPTTTTRWSIPTRQWPYFTSSTASPTRQTTERMPMTTTRNDWSMRLFWRCASWYHDYRDAFSCALCLFLCSSSGSCNSCFNDVTQTRNIYPFQTPPVTATNRIFYPVPTQLFPTFPPTTRPPVLYPDLLGVYDSSHSYEITEQELMHFLMLRGHFN